MKGYIPRQPKQIKERIEAKLDERLIGKLEKYCEYLDSDRDYVIGQALQIAFKKDKGFDEWLAAHDAAAPVQTPGADPIAGAKPGRRPGRTRKPQVENLRAEALAALEGASTVPEGRP